MFSGTTMLLYMGLVERREGDAGNGYFPFSIFHFRFSILQRLGCRLASRARLSHEVGVTFGCDLRGGGTTLAHRRMLPNVTDCYACRGALCFPVHQYCCTWHLLRNFMKRCWIALHEGVEFREARLPADWA